MLDTKLTIAGLYSMKEIEGIIYSCKKRISLLTSFKYNINMVPTIHIFDKVQELSKRIENLCILKNAIYTALLKVTPIQKKIIKLFYFENKMSNQVMKQLNLSVGQFKHNKRSAVETIAFFMFMFGFTTDRFVEYFNEETVIVRKYIKQQRYIKNAKNFKSCGAVEPLYMQESVGRML